MNDIQTIITERVDDLPLLLEQMQRMNLPTLIDHHFPTHGNWQGLSLGGVSPLWRRAILSRGDHRLVHVEPWVDSRLRMLRRATGPAVERLDFPDDRLEVVLQYVSDDMRWAQFESALNQHPVRVYDLRCDRMHVDSTTASAYAPVSESGLLQFGHSKEHRPDLPHVKVMQAVLDPLGMPVATDVVSGDRADAPLYLPCIQRLQASLGRRGLCDVGDCKMAARETRAFIAARGDYYLCPWPQVQRAGDAWDEALEALWSGEHTRMPIMREGDDSQPELMAEGSERRGPMRQESEGAEHSWSERRLVVRSLRQAQAAEAALRARVAKAKAQGEAVNVRGRGRKRYEDIEPLRQAAHEIVQRHGGAEFLWLRYDQHPPPHQRRASRGRPVQRREERQATVAVREDEDALEAAVRRLGWRMYGTTQPPEQLSLAQAVFAYRQEYLVERSFGRLTGRPLSLRPLYVHRDAHATGLIRLLSIGLRVLTLLEYVVRRQLAAPGEKLAGLSVGNTKRETVRPTAERLLEAFQEMTLTVVEGATQTSRHLTALRPLHVRILELLGFSSQVYTRLCTISDEPP
jgi:transposase